MFDGWHGVVLHDDVGQPARQRLDDQPRHAAAVSIRTLNLGAEWSDALCGLGVHAALVVAVERSCRAAAYPSRSCASCRSSSNLVARSAWAASASRTVMSRQRSCSSASWLAA